MRRFGLLFPYLMLFGVVAVVALSNIPAYDADSAETASRITMCAPCGMDVDPATALSAEIGGRPQYFCNDECRQQGIALAEAAPHVGRLVDVVCNMEVNAAWGITSDYNRRTYHFCLDKCQKRFDADPELYLASKCVVCSEPIGDRASLTATYLGRPYELCGEEHRAMFKADPAEYFMHSMWGIPTWLYYASIALVLVVSFGVFDWLSRMGDSRNSPGDASGESAPGSGSARLRGEGERLVDRAFQGRPATALSAVPAMPAMSIALPILSAPPLAFQRHGPREGTGWPGAAAHPTGAVAHSAVAALTADTTSRTGGPAPASTPSIARFDLLSVAWIGWALRSRVFRFAMQAFFVASFFLVIAAGLFGNQNPSLNIAPILTWTIWWALLIVLIMFAGKAWCYVCPWDAVAGWAEKLRFWKKTDDGLSLGLKWPRIIRNISIATIMFVGLTWIELGFGVTMKPRITAYLAIGMLMMAVVSALLFDRKSFCRYGCLVGRVSGLYAMFASTEVRARDADVCAKCRTKECIKGSETAYGCPTFLYPGKLETNTYCIQCMECVQACPHDNMAVNLRPWGGDLAIEGKPRADEAYLALLMLSITGFHGLTMTPVWEQFVDSIRQFVDAGRILSFSLGMAALMVAPIAIYAVLVGVSKFVADRSGASEGTSRLDPLSYRDYFVRYAYALLPIALFYHVAHNLEHLLMEGPKVLALLSDPFGWNWNIFGTAHWNLPPMISLDKLWLIQVFLVLVGHVYSLWVAQKTSLRLFGTSKAAFRSQLPMLVGMICFSVFSLWLLKQPMEMRTSAM